MKFSTGHAEVQAEGFSQTAAFTIAQDSILRGWKKRLGA